jgi:hypothetical protein
MANFEDIHTLEIEARVNEKIVRREIYPLPEGAKGKLFEEVIYQGPHNGKQSFILDLIYEIKSKGKAKREFPGHATNLVYTWKVKTQVIKTL